MFRQSGKGLQFATQFCHEPCSPEQLEVRTRDFVAKLVQGARARARPSTLYVRSNPPRAEIRLDQALVGVTDMDFSVYPGTHVVSLSKKGFQRAIREVTVDDGETVTLDVTLQPQAGTTKPETSTDKPARSSPSPRPTSPRPVARPRSGWVAWTVLGAGGAALVGAGALVLLDQDERSQDGIRQQDVRQTAWYGVGLGAAGAAAVGVGLVLLFRPAAETTPAPAIALDHQAAWLGVRGAF